MKTIAGPSCIQDKFAKTLIHHKYEKEQVVNTHRQFMHDSKNYRQSLIASLRISDLAECLAKQLDLPRYQEFAFQESAQPVQPGRQTLKGCPDK